MLQSQKYSSGGKLRSWVPVFIVLAAIPAMFGPLSLLPNRKENWIGLAAWGIMLGMGILAAGVAFFVAIRLKRAANRRLAAAIEREGFTPALESTEEQRAAVLEGMTPVALLESGGTVGWFAWQKIEGEKLPAVVMQHSHIIGSGRTAHEHFRTIVAWPLPQVKPEIWMRRPRAGHFKLKGTAGTPDVIVGDKAFDKAFLVQCPADAAAPGRLLTPSIREFILAGPKRESWVLARGYACCIFHADIATDGLLVMLRRAREMAEMWRST
jgi:hypothetical protein